MAGYGLGAGYGANAYVNVGPGALGADCGPGAGYGGFWTSTGVILVLFILLLIISRTFFL